jgi:hypothetical protein
MRLRLHEKGGKEHEMPVHHLLEQILDEYIPAAGLQSGQPLFPSVNSVGTAVTGALRPFVGIPPVMHDPTVRSPDRATRASLPRSHLAFDAPYGVKTDVQTSNEAAVQMSMKIEGALFRLKDMVLGCQIRLSASKRLR